MSTVIITDSTTLRELNVSYNDIGDKGISVITEGLQSNKMLANLLVSWCRFSLKGIYKSVDMYMCNTLCSGSKAFARKYKIYCPVAREISRYCLGTREKSRYCPGRWLSMISYLLIHSLIQLVISRLLQHEL